MSDLALSDVGISPLTTTFALQESLLLPRTPISPSESTFGGLGATFTFPPKPMIPDQQSLEAINEVDEERQESVLKIGDTVRHTKADSDEKKRKWSKRGSESCIAQVVTRSF